MMKLIILDTNVVSEAMVAQPDPNVARWLSNQVETDLYIVAITKAELRYGVELLPQGRRRRDLESRVESILTQCFEGRILPFDADAAGIYAWIRASMQKSGRSVGVEDTMILGIAKSVNAAVATRNIRDFKESGIEFINPWEYSP